MTDEISQAAKDLCAGWFMFGEKATVCSHAPHAALTANRAAMDELLGAGLVTERPFNKFGSVEFKGTVKAGEIGRQRGAELMRMNFAARADGEGR